MKLKYLLVALFELLMQNVLGQVDYIALYHNTDFTRSTIETREEGSVRLYTEVNEFFYTRPSIAIGFRKDSRWSHEIQASYTQERPPIEHEYRDSDKRLYDGHFVSLSHDLQYRLNPEQSNLNFHMALRYSPYLSSRRYYLDDPAWFDLLYTDWGILSSFLGKIDLKISENLSIESALRISFLDLRLERSNIKNPSIPRRQQFKMESSYAIFPISHSLQVGLRYHLN